MDTSPIAHTQLDLAELAGWRATKDAKIDSLEILIQSELRALRSDLTGSIDRIGREMDARMGTAEQQGNRIEAQVTSTNGRVGKLEEWRRELMSAAKAEAAFVKGRAAMRKTDLAVVAAVFAGISWALTNHDTIRAWFG